MDWLEIVIPPVLIGIGAVITLFIKSKREELLAIEKKLHDERRSVYLKFLDPYIMIFTDLSKKNIKKAVNKITSYDYRKTAFELNLFASDEVIKAYNNLMHHAYETEKTGIQDSNKMLHLFGTLVLETRKNLGNKKTRLNSIDMLKGMIKGMEKIE